MHVKNNFVSLAVQYSTIIPRILYLLLCPEEFSQHHESPRNMLETTKTGAYSINSNSKLRVQCQGRIQDFDTGGEFL